MAIRRSAKSPSTAPAIGSTISNGAKKTSGDAIPKARLTSARMLMVR
jgi:hypothetical protein